jgi:GNAT superfamily N-acetyltransferase
MPLPTPLRVTAVRTSADHRAFWTLPYDLYRRTPGWPAPLRRDERRRWDPRHNPSLAGRPVWRFVAWRGRMAVGRIAAVFDPEFARRWSPATGLFGFFECGDDSDVSAALFGAAEAALRAEGLARAIGPVNLTFHDEMGLLVGGFDISPSFLTPFHPPYYQSLLEREGYRPLVDQHAYRWTHESPPHPAVGRAVRRVMNAGTVVRAMRHQRWESELRLLHALYNESFDGVWGFVPIGWEDFRLRAEGFKRFYRPELVRIAEVDGRPVGFVLALPDLNPLLATVRGRLFPIGAAYLALRVPRLREARCMLLAVAPGWTGRGIALALVTELAAAAGRLGLTGGELALVHADNRAARHVIEVMGGAPVRTYRLYQKDLG